MVDRLTPGQALEQKTPESSQTEKQKLENQRRAEMLRAKLMAVRRNTPAKAKAKATTPAPTTETPSKAPITTASQPKLQPQQTQQKQKQEEVEAQTQFPPQPQPQHFASELDLEALLTAGKAHADAQTAAAAAAAQQKAVAAPRDTQEMDLFPAKLQQRDQHQYSTDSTPPPPNRPTNLADAYYTDLAAWLDMTGYHDVDYRESKLRTYKERRALEEEAARIAEKLEKLRQAEESEMQLLRLGTPSVKAPAMAPPPLPQTLVQPVNGVKRGRSPVYATAEKRQREENGFRIRGMKESPEQRPASSARRPGSLSPGLERHATHADARRRSVNGRGPPGGHSRDPSLERRAQYYRRDDEQPRPDQYTPRPAPHEPRLNHGNPTGNGVRQGRPNGREMENSYRPSAGLEMKKGGQSYHRPR